MTDLQDKTILITGGTSGIGRETAVGLAKMGAHVIVTGRDEKRGLAGVTDIQTRSGNPNVDLLLADLSSLNEVRRLAHEVQQQYERLDVLINNVGYLPSERHLTVDGIEATLAVNHVAPFVLTQELLPLLESSAPSRVINVTGGAPTNSAIDFKNLQAEKSFLSLATYTHAKKIMMATSYAFAKRLEDTGVMLNVAYPGPANTNMTSDMTPDMMPWYMRLAFPVFRIFMSNAKPENAAVSTIYLASSSDVEGVNGKYFNTKGKQTSWHSSLIGQDIPERLWDYTMSLINETSLKAA